MSTFESYVQFLTLDTSCISRSAAAHSPTYRHSSYRTRHGSSSTSSSNHSGSSSTSYPTFRRHQSVLDDSLTSTTSEWPESAEWYMKTYSATDIQQYLDRTAHLSDVDESPSGHSP